MPPQVPYSNHDKSYDNGEYERRLTREELIALTNEAFELYKEKEGYVNSAAGSMSEIGATASRYENAPVAASELAQSYELPELTLEQLGRNIEAVRYDAIHKEVNSADVFIAKKSDYDLAA